MCLACLLYSLRSSKDLIKTRTRKIKREDEDEDEEMKEMNEMMKNEK